jgi:hypothetical protein
MGKRDGLALYRVVGECRRSISIISISFEFKADNFVCDALRKVALRKEQQDNRNTRAEVYGPTASTNA